MRGQQRSTNLQALIMLISLIGIFVAYSAFQDMKRYNNSFMKKGISGLKSRLDEKPRLIASSFDYDSFSNLKRYKASEINGKWKIERIESTNGSDISRAINNKGELLLDSSGKPIVKLGAKPIINAFGERVANIGVYPFKLVSDEIVEIANSSEQRYKILKLEGNKITLIKKTYNPNNYKSDGIELIEAVRVRKVKVKKKAKEVNSKLAHIKNVVDSLFANLESCGSCRLEMVNFHNRKAKKFIKVEKEFFSGGMYQNEGKIQNVEISINHAGKKVSIVIDEIKLQAGWAFNAIITDSDSHPEYRGQKIAGVFSPNGPNLFRLSFNKILNDYTLTFASENYISPAPVQSEESIAKTKAGDHFQDSEEKLRAFERRGGNFKFRNKGILNNIKKKLKGSKAILRDIRDEYEEVDSFDETPELTNELRRDGSESFDEQDEERFEDEEFTEYGEEYVQGENRGDENISL